MEQKKYPLEWPVGYPRKAKPKRSNFGERSLDRVTKELHRELDRLKASNIVISSNIPLRRDNKPYSTYQKGQLDDKGVAVYFVLDNNPKVLCCDAWDYVEDNLWAICKTIDSMRGMERWGVSEIMERSFAGLHALPMIATGINPWDILDMEKTKDKAAITGRYKQLARERQFDEMKMRDLNVARDIALKYAEE